MLAIGLDIGGTKCAVSLGRVTKSGIELLHRCEARPTAGTPREMLDKLAGDIQSCEQRAEQEPLLGVGISCGGPLNSARGVILSPPNLPGWDEVAVVDAIREQTGIDAWLCNDANACALAEWRFGAGIGSQNMVFLTFGTGMGAGLILNGRLYGGANDMAGEVGHVRLRAGGPVGYGKAGSFEGFCSGGGIAQLAKAKVLELHQRGLRPALCPDSAGLESLSAKTIGKAAAAGDELAREILALSGERLGEGLALLIDLINPELIVIGSVFSRCREFLWPAAAAVIEREALPAARAVCRVLPSALGESVGDVAALAVAAYYGEQNGGNLE